MVKIKLTMAELSRRTRRNRATLYSMKKAFPDQYRYLVIGVLAELWAEAQVREVENML